MHVITDCIKKILLPDVYQSCFLYMNGLSKPCSVELYNYLRHSNNFKKNLYISKVDFESKKIYSELLVNKVKSGCYDNFGKYSIDTMKKMRELI